MKTLIRAHAAPWYGGVEILIQQRINTANASGSYFSLNLDNPAPEWRQRNEFECCPPSLRIDNRDAQVLMDDLWASGLRPTEGTGSAGALRATEKHLEDMRKLVFEKR